MDSLNQWILDAGKFQSYDSIMSTIELKFGAGELIPVILQQSPHGAVILHAYTDEKALLETKKRKHVCLIGENNALIEKKELEVEEIKASKDGKALLYLCKVNAPVNGTENPTFFTHSLFGECNRPGPLLLDEIETVLKGRMDSKDPHSYTAKLLKGNPEKIREKIIEESLEVVEASKHWDVVNLAEEVADLLFHSMLLLLRHGIELSDVLLELQKRRGKRRNAPPPVND